MRATIAVTLAAAAALIAPATAVYRDEAYTVDYHHALLGLPAPDATFFHRPDTSSPASLLYTLSDLGVLGAVKPGSGDLVWRQYLAANANRTIGGKGTDNEIEGLLRPVEGQDTIISAVGGYVNAWTATNGKEQWYNEFTGTARDLEVASNGDAVALFQDKNNEVRIRRLDGKFGNVKWEYALEHNDLGAQVNVQEDTTFVVSLHSALIGDGYSLRVTSLDSTTGGKKEEHTLSTKADIHAREDVLFVGSNGAAPIVVWASKDKNTLHVNVLGTKKIHDMRIDSTEDIQNIKIHAPQSASSAPHFLVHIQRPTKHWAVVYYLHVASGAVKEAYEIPALPGHGAFSTSENEGELFFTRITNDKMVLYSSTSKIELGSYPLAPSSSGLALHAVSEVVKKSEGYAVRSVMATTEDNWVMVKNGALGWERTEGLSGAVAAAFAEIPEVETLAKALDVEAHSNPIAAYSHRLSRHIGELQNLPGYLSQVPMRLLNAVVPGDATPVDAGALARDNFGFRKLVILATERGRVFCLDTANAGAVVWNHKVFDIPAGQKWDVKGIFVDNAAGEVTVRGGEDEYIVMRVANGTTVELGAPVDGRTIQATAVVDSAEGKHLLSVAEGGVLPAVPKDEAPKDTLVVRGPDNSINGMKFTTSSSSEQAHADAIWTFRPATGERVLSVSSRPPHDPVASIGRALADRSVLYKYLNPNLILVTAVNDAASTLSLYLLDSVSGAVVYSASHKDVDTTQDIATALSENWFTYTFFSAATGTTSAQGYQLVISELYESALPNDRGANPSGNYSSLEPSEVPDSLTTPHVVSQSFIIPEPISHLGVTQTRQGITSRVLIASLPRSNGILAIPRNLVDARRQVREKGKPSANDMEEGVVPYSPILDFDPRGLLSHERQVVGVRNIITSPALLESTSLVFAYGLDVFGTRAMPSGTFDVLGVGFNKVTLTSTVVGLFAAVMMVAPIVRRKMIDGKWRS